MVNIFWIVVIIVIRMIVLNSNCHSVMLELTLKPFSSSEQQSSSSEPQSSSSEQQSSSSEQVLPPRRVLIVGLITTLQEIFIRNDDNNDDNVPNVIKSIGQLCSSMTREEGGVVDVHLMYQIDHRNDTKNDLRFILESAGCRVALISEQHAFLKQQQYEYEQYGTNYTTIPDLRIVSRYKRIGKLRSLQRSVILSQAQRHEHDYHVVMNVDFDLVTLPKSSIIRRTIEQVSTNAETPKTIIGTTTTNKQQRQQQQQDGHHQDDNNNNKNQQQQQQGTIICANGYQIWQIPFIPSKWQGRRYPHMYYDTVAAVDRLGHWYYPKYTRVTIPPMSVMFQSNLFQQILFYQQQQQQASNNVTTTTTANNVTTTTTTTTTLWPMQSCFGGLAIYDWNTWAFPDCDYDATQITLLMDDDKQQWQPSPKYSLSGTVDGDICEHVVFQQCLQAAAAKQAAAGLLSQQQRQHNNDDDDDNHHQMLPILEVGIKSDLVLERGY